MKVSDDTIPALFMWHCECRPVDIRRQGHSHDCDTDITDDCRLAIIDGDSEARTRCEERVRAHVEAGRMTIVEAIISHEETP